MSFKIGKRERESVSVCNNNVFFVYFVFFIREFYNLNKNSEELRIKDLDEVDSGYFAVEYNNQWHRVEPYDTRMGEAVRVNDHS